ncbi:MAG: hypothetical protein WB439_12040 [Acidobacteriaceae bacterium]
MNRKTILITLTLLFAASCLSAQQVSPMPPQLLSAKTVFISNTTAAFGLASDNGYNQFYTAVQKLAHFTITAAPAQADLILEFGLGSGPNYPNPNGIIETLRIVDSHSGVVLWSVSEAGDSDLRQQVAEKNAQTAANHLAADLLRVCSPISSSASTPKPTRPKPASDDKKTRFSQQPQ